jgi:hypothetical protein
VRFVGPIIKEITVEFFAVLQRNEQLQHNVPLKEVIKSGSYSKRKQCRACSSDSEEKDAA